MDKIKMTNPIVEMDGDEMTRIIWEQVKNKLIYPYIDLNSEYYDLGLKSRDNTRDRITHDAAAAVRKYGVGVKCATITPNRARVEEYNLREMYPSPNATIRAALDGTVFRAPIMVKGINPYIPNWKAPITIARHAYGDLYKAVEIIADGEGVAELVFTGADGSIKKEKVMEFKGPGILQAQHNTLSSIRSFAYSCFNFALDTKQDLWFSAKDTISKKYDQTFKEIFAEIYEAQYKERFQQAGIKYFYTLIDDAVARVIKSKGGFIWALKNYDGDVMSDMVATAFGALAMMTSVLVSPDGNFEYEAAHGTVQQHYYKHLKGEETSTNSVATIFAWTGALRKRGQMDHNDELVAWADKMEKAVISTIEQGYMTKDLASITTIPNPVVLNTNEFIDAINRVFNGQAPVDGPVVSVYSPDLEGTEAINSAVKSIFEEKKPEPAANADFGYRRAKVEKTTEELYEEFLDAKSYKRKREILRQLGGELTDKMITDFAVSLDVVVEDGPFDTRYTGLIRSLDQMCRFETEGLR